MFDYNKFDAQCATMTTEQLRGQLQNATETTTTSEKRHSGINFLDSLSAHHSQKKKKQIIEKHLKAHDIETSHIEHANAQPVPVNNVKPLTVAEYQNQRASMDQHQMWQNTHGGVSPTSQSPTLPAHTHHHHSTHRPKRDSLKCHISRVSESAAPLTPPGSDEALDEPVEYELPESIVPVGCGHTGACGNPLDGCCAHLYPNSAMHHHAATPESRHVHFAV